MSTILHPNTVAPTGTWVVDPHHSCVEFQVKHMGITTVKGRFTEFEGRIVIPDDVRETSAAGTVQVASVDTHQPQRDAHLRAPDFFDAAHFPEMRFESSSAEPIDADTLRIAGRLALHGITREIVLEAVVHGVDTDPWGNDRLGLEAVAQIDRADFDMKFNQALGSGNLIVSNDVKLVLDLSAVRAV